MIIVAFVKLAETHWHVINASEIVTPTILNLETICLTPAADLDQALLVVTVISSEHDIARVAHQVTAKRGGPHSSICNVDKF